jgi:hypothetical protein
MVLSYLREGAFGSCLDVLCTKTERDRYFRTVDENGAVCLEAHVILND